MAYAIVRTDLMRGSKNPAFLVNLKYGSFAGNKFTPEDVENGCVVKTEGLESRDVFYAVAATKETEVDDLVLVASPESLYDQRQKNLNEFVNEAGQIARGYRLGKGDIFSVTQEALTGSLAQGNYVELDDSNKLAAVNTPTESATTVGKIERVEVVGPDTYYVIVVE